MADYYVSTTGSDSNAGTREAPFRTILKASQAAAAGSTVHVATGTYTGGFQTTKSDIAYVSDVTWGARIVPGAGNSRVEAWDNRGSGVIIDGFEIDGSSPRGGTPWLFGIYTAGSNSVVQNVKVHDLVRDSAAWSAANSRGQGGAGIMGDGWTGGTNITVKNSVVYDIGPSDTSSGLVHGIYMATSGSVLNNVVHTIVGDGITSWHDATDLKIVNNTISGAHGAGILVGAGDHYRTNGPNDHTQVSNNILHNNAKGIEDGGQVGSHNAYTNNLMYGNGTSWALRYGTAGATVGGDPLFVNAATGDFRLRAGSPAIDAGTSAGAPALDIGGSTREGAVDIGAYEYRAAAVPQPPSAPTPTPAPQPGSTTHTLRNGETLTGGAAADWVNLDNGDVSVTLTQVETLLGGSGGDWATLAGDGNTLVLAAIETLVGGAGADWVELGNRGNTLVLAAIETLVGGSGNDVVTLGNRGNTLVLAAIETLQGGSGGDLVTLGNRGNTLAVSGVETLLGGVAADTVTLGGGDTIVRLSHGADTLVLSRSTAVERVAFGHPDNGGAAGVNGGFDDVFNFQPGIDQVVVTNTLKALVDHNGDGTVAMVRRATGTADFRTDEVVELTVRPAILVDEGFVALRQALGTVSAAGTPSNSLVLATNGTNSGLYWIGDNGDGVIAADEVRMLARFRDSILSAADVRS